MSLILLFNGPLAIPEAPPPSVLAYYGGVAGALGDGLAAAGAVGDVTGTQGALGVPWGEAGAAADLTQATDGVADPWTPTGRLQ